ncbi:hypothetical protein FHG87_019728, partial [Trinorchestia longiramus]
MTSPGSLQPCIFYYFVLLCLVTSVVCNRLQGAESGIKCCTRRSKIISVGKDAVSGNIIDVDIGECDNRCNHHNHHHQHNHHNHHHQHNHHNHRNHQRIKKERFQQLLRENSHLSPEE